MGNRYSRLSSQVGLPPDLRKSGGYSSLRATVSIRWKSSSYIGFFLPREHFVCFYLGSMKLEYQDMIFTYRCCSITLDLPKSRLMKRLPRLAGCKTNIFFFFFWGGGVGARGLIYVPSCWWWLREDSGSHAFKPIGHESVLKVPNFAQNRRISKGICMHQRRRANSKSRLGGHEDYRFKPMTQFRDKHDHKIPSQSTPIPHSWFKRLCRKKRKI